jgi:hypothetical protein
MVNTRITIMGTATTIDIGLTITIGQATIGIAAGIIGIRT